MLPLLKFSGDGEEHTRREAIDRISAEFVLTETERNQLLPSGRQRVLDNRIDWARAYLKQSALIEPTEVGCWRITSKGLEVLKKNPARIDLKYLSQFPEFLEFRARRRTQPTEPEDEKPPPIQTPQELLEDGYQRIRDKLLQDLLSYVKKRPPEFFEKMVVELLVKMGYGGSQKDAGKAIGRSGDEGIDGIIKEDKLGLDVIYIQAKRWEGTVGRPEIHKFVGALQGQRANKGIFITTSTFSDEARQYASSIPTKIVLIDGEELADLMISNDIGVSRETSYEIKRIDNDYFSEE